MIRSIPDLTVDVIPQAVVDMPLADILRNLADITEGEDDLDRFEGASFKLDDQIEIALRHYAGYPANTSTIYIDRRIQNVDDISRLIRAILGAFGVDEHRLSWERADDPDL